MYTAAYSSFGANTNTESYSAAQKGKWLINQQRINLQFSVCSSIEKVRINSSGFIPEDDFLLRSTTNIVTKQK